MSKQLIIDLSNLKLQRDYLLRQIDIHYYDKNLRHTYFTQLKKIDRDIEKVKFKIKMEKRLKNDTNSNTNQSDN